MMKKPYFVVLIVGIASILLAGLLILLVTDNKVEKIPISKITGIDWKLDSVSLKGNVFQSDSSFLKSITFKESGIVAFRFKSDSLSGLWSVENATPSIIHTWIPRMERLEIKELDSKRLILACDVNEDLKLIFSRY